MADKPTEKKQSDTNKPKTFPETRIVCASCFGYDVVRFLWRLRDWMRAHCPCKYWAKNKDGQCPCGHCHADVKTDRTQD